MSQAGLIDVEAANPQIPTSFTTDAGTAIPILNNLEILGGTGATTSASGKTITVTVDSSVLTITGDTGGAISPSSDNWNLLGGSNLTVAGSGSTLTVSLEDITQYAVQIGGASNSLAQSSVGSDGQILIGATGASPAFANISSTGGTVTISNGANSLNLEVAGSVATQYDADSGSAVPAAGVLTVSGSGSIATSGAASTLTIALTGLTNHAVLVGAGTSTITKVGPTATVGQVLQSAGAAADPAFSTATYPLTTTINQILYSSAADTITGLATANKAVLTTGATGVPALTAISTDGTFIIGSTAGAPASGTITSTGSTVSVSLGSNTINLETGAAVATSYTCDSGSAVPALGVLTIAGGTGCATSGATSIVTIDLDATVPLSFPTDSGTATPAANALTLTGGNGIATSGAAAVATIAMSSPFTGDFTFTDSTAGDTELLTVSNTDNTAANASSAALALSVGGSTQIGDPYLYFATGSARSYAIGTDTSDSQVMKWTTDTAASVTPSSGTTLMSLTSAGLLAIPLATGSTNGLVVGGTTSGTNDAVTVTGAGTGTILQVGIRPDSGTRPILIVTSGSASEDPSVEMGTNSSTQWTFGVLGGSSNNYVLRSGGSISTGSIVQQFKTTGEMVLPLQPSFSARLGTADANQTGDGTEYVLGTTGTALTELYDVNGDFATTGIFTAPVDGHYYFKVTYYLTGIGASHTDAIIKFTAGGVAYYGSRLSPAAAQISTGGDANTINMSDSIVLALTATQTVITSVTVSGSTKTVGIGSGGGTDMNTYFQGYLIG